MNNKLLVASGLLLSGMLFLGAGCGSSTTNTNTANANNTNTAPVVKPSITIVSPVDGATVDSQVPLEVKISDFKLAPNAVDKPNVAGQGHYHVAVDGKYHAVGTATSMTLTDATGKGLTSGAHTIQVSLQNNDHSDVENAVASAVIDITVK